MEHFGPILFQHLVTLTGIQTWDSEEVRKKQRLENKFASFVTGKTINSRARNDEHNNYGIIEKLSSTQIGLSQCEEKIGSICHQTSWTRRPSQRQISV